MMCEMFDQFNCKLPYLKDRVENQSNDAYSQTTNGGKFEAMSSYNL